MRSKTSLQHNRGAVLIMVAAVLAVLAALATGFYTMTLSQSVASMHYSNSVRADLLAKGGVDAAVAQLRQAAYIKTEEASDPWYGVHYLSGADHVISFPATDSLGKVLSYSGSLGNSNGTDSDRFLLNVSDAGSRINVNACDNLAVVLDNLCRLIGPPLVAANQDMLIPMVWQKTDSSYTFGVNANDTNLNGDAYYQLYDDSASPNGVLVTDDTKGRPERAADGTALYGDGYAIAGYRSRHGKFMQLADVKKALTFVKRPDGNTQLEDLEREVKFAAIGEYITLESWIDTNTVCTGKFEWINTDTAGGFSIAIDRDKSWVAPSPGDAVAFRADPNKFYNQKGSLLGCYLSIINGHGAGQLRIIVDNGTDWIRVEPPFTIDPGPISSYMIVAREPARYLDAGASPVTALPTPLATTSLMFPETDNAGNLISTPNVDYARFPLCIHRAPVNINTASDKVLGALILGMNVQYAHPLSIGTDVDVRKLAAFPLGKFSTYLGGLPNSTDWRVVDDVNGSGEEVLTGKGLKRIPADTGELILDKTLTANVTADPAFSYLNNKGNLSGFIPSGVSDCNEVHQFVYRVLVARQQDSNNPTFQWIDAQGNATSTNTGVVRGAFKSWDDFYFRVVKPWDDARMADPVSGPAKVSVARMVMANFNSNTDILKFNPNIEWIDRWGRNFTEMEPIMVYSSAVGNTTPVVPVTNSSIPIYCKSEGGLKAFQANLYDYVTRSFRYKSSDLIDKTDLNRSTTEFSFDSGGVYHIKSTGQVLRTGNVAAERAVDAVVKVYNVWRESTQRQFVQGTIEAGPAMKTLYPAGTVDSPGTIVTPGTGPRGSTCSGKIARDAVNVNGRLPLTTLPEPLVPLTYRIKKTLGTPNAEVVDTAALAGRDAWGNAKDAITVYGMKGDLTMPDIVANRVLPAGYDGQIILATNTSAFNSAMPAKAPGVAGDPASGDTFLASFNGDLDTETCLGNGREQAKTPINSKVRVVDTIGLLGALNDTFVDVDPDIGRAVYKFSTVNAAIKGLDAAYFENNCTVRQGDLRADGVYLSGPGCAGNDATLKYLFGAGAIPKLNLDPASIYANNMSMWIKPTWHHNDNRTHEFFNGSNPGGWWNSRQLWYKKHGRFAWAVSDDGLGSGLSGSRARNNDLLFAWEGVNAAAGTDRDVDGYLFGGTNRVTRATPVESPGYRIQPFRWQFTGARWGYHLLDASYQLLDGNGGSRGIWVTTNGAVGPAAAPGYESNPQLSDIAGAYSLRKNQQLLQWYVRPFIDSQRDPEGPTTWKPDMFSTRNAIYGMPSWFDKPSDLGNTGGINGGGTTGQDVKYDWADPAGSNTVKCFGVNNLNYNNDIMIYRNVPEEGTHAVISEFKLSNVDKTMWTTPDWVNDRIVGWDAVNNRTNGEMTLSRYYLPPNPADPNQCPIFTSQTLLQSLRGFDKTIGVDDVTLVRVTWTVFTPRFMSEYKMPGTFTRTEVHTYDRITPKTETVPFKGPFNYDQYNDDTDTTLYSVNRRPPPQLPLQGQATRGVEVELLNGAAVIPGFENSTGAFLAASTFTNPDVINRFGDPAAGSFVSVPSDKLRYRVRFRYPVDTNVDPTGGIGAVGRKSVDPTKQYLLDTPVFDDISVTYITKPVFFSYGELSE